MNIPDSLSPVGPAAAPATRAHNARRITALGFAIMALATLGYTFIALLYGNWQLFACAVVFAIFTLSILPSRALIRRGRVELGIWLILGAMQLTFLVASLLIAGLGVAFACVTLLTVVIVLQTLQAGDAYRASVIGIFAGVVMVLVDLFDLPFRLPAPDLLVVYALLMSGVAILIYGYFLYRQFRSYTLRAKLITAFLIVTLIPLALLAYLNDRGTRANLTANIGTSLKALANAQALIIGNELDRQVTQLQALSYNPDLRAAAAAASAAYTGTPESIQSEINKLDLAWRAADAANNSNDPLVYAHLNNPWADRLRDYRTILPDNVELFVTDKYGALVAASNRTSDYNQADEDWWQATYRNGQGAIYIGQVEYDESSKTYSSNIAVPLYSSDSKSIVGVLRTTLQLGTLLGNLNVTRLGQTGYSELFVSGRQKLVGGSEKPVPVDEKTLAQVGAAAQSDYIEMTYGGIPSLVSQAIVSTSTPTRAAAIRQLGWLVVVHQDQSEGLAPLRAQTRTAMLLALLIAAAVIGVGIAAAQLLSGPIVRLIASAQRVTAGNWSVQVPVEAQDETGMLANAFNVMVAQLHQTLAGLEQRVAERTAALERHSKYLVALQDTTVAMVSHLDVDELLQTIVTRAGALVGTPHGYVFLLDPQTGEMTMRVGTGTYANLVGTHARFGEGLAGTVWQTGEPLIVDDYQHWAGRLSGHERSQLQSVVGVALKSGTHIVGVIGLAYVESGRKFDADEVEVLGRFAQLASIALENARLYQEQAALAAENQKLLAQAHETAAENRVLFERAQQTTEELNALARRLTREGWTEYLSAQHEELWIENTESDRAANSGDLPALAQSMREGTMVTSEGEKRAIAVPIVVRGQVVGSLAAEDVDSQREWGPDDVEVLKDIAEHTALALDNARLYEQTQVALAETQRRAEREAKLASINDRLHASTDVQRILQIAIEELRRATGRPHAAVWLPSQDGQSTAVNSMPHDPSRQSLKQDTV